MEKPKVLYLYDPMCGWCYGFSSVIDKLEQQYADQVEFEVLSGGMVMGDRVGPVSEVASYIGSGYKRVENLTGMKFGQNFLDLYHEGSYIYSSEKACIAMTVFKETHPDKAISFAHDLQKAFFFDGKSLNDDQTFLDLVQAYDVKPQDFQQKLQDSSYRATTFQEFARVGEYGVGGFPSVIYQSPDTAFLLTEGYRSYEEMEQAMEWVIKKAK